MSQYEQVLKHLQEGKSITQYEATIRYGILRLDAIVFGLRRAGYPIKTKMVHKKNKNGNTTNYAEYSLKVKENDNA